MLALENRIVANVDNTSEVFKNTIMAARSAHQEDKMDHAALIAALQAFEDHHPCESEDGRVAGRQMTYVTSEWATDWSWRELK